MGWVNDDRHLSAEEMQNNASMFYAALSKMGASLNLISGILGNAQSESSINPGRGEVGGGGGFGLLQWTPASKLIDWCNQNGMNYRSGDAQCKRIEYEKNVGIQWAGTGMYPLSFMNAWTSQASPEYLASAFLYNYERPLSPGATEAARRSQARYWYDFLNQYAEGARKIESAVQWAIQIANDDRHGYDQRNRWGPDYDCGTLVTSAYRQAGVDIAGGTGINTMNMEHFFTGAGFEVVSVDFSSGNGLIRGDVLLNTLNHTAMYIGDGKVVQASMNEFGDVTGGQEGDQTGGEIAVGRYYNYPWNLVLRYPGAGGGSPTQGVYIVRFIPK